MGKYLGKKCKGVVGEKIAVVGVKTRAKAALAMAATTSSPPSKKIKKVPRSCHVHHHHQLKNRRRNLSAPEISGEIGAASSEVVQEEVANCSATSSSDFLPSCSSSNYDQSSSSSEVVKDRLEITMADPEVESAEESSRDKDCQRTDEAREATKSDGHESPTRKSTVQIKMPSDSEIQEFFASAEKDLHKRFSDKYNFDIAKDVPLKGRYDWVPIKP